MRGDQNDLIIAKISSRLAPLLLYGLAVIHFYGAAFIIANLNQSTAIPLFGISRIYDAHLQDIVAHRSGPLFLIFLVILVAIYLAAGLRKLKLHIWYEAMFACGFLLLIRGLMLPNFFDIIYGGERLGRWLIFGYCLITTLTIYEARQAMREENYRGSQ